LLMLDKFAKIYSNYMPERNWGNHNWISG
jgi:hypothetical protein